MACARPRPLNRLDVALVGLFAPVALAASFATDLEFMLRYHNRGSIMGAGTRWPDWVYGLKDPATRVYLDGLAALVVMGLGLTLATFRPRGAGVRRRSGPGHVASVLVASFAVAILVQGVLRAWLEPRFRTVVLFFHFDFYTYWSMLSARVPTAILGAWAFFALTGRWRPPIDWADRLGRWLGWCWLGSMIWYGVILLIVWG